MRRALGLTGDRAVRSSPPRTERPQAGPLGRPAGRSSADKPRHRFVQDGAVPVTVISRHRPDEADGLPTGRAAIEAAQDKKANGVVVLDLKKAGAFTDYFVICSASNPRQVQAIADAVEEALKAQKQRPSLVEGYARAEWILLDYFDFVIHVFSKHARDFYALDRLWGSATRIEFPDVA